MTVMAGRFKAPVTPSLAELNSQALAGDDDALRMLVARSTTCETLTELLERFVPSDEIGLVFDRYADAMYFEQQKRARALVETIELPTVPPKDGNLNVGWQE